MSADRRVINCQHQWPARFRVQFKFECPKRWDLLSPTADENTRHCSACDQPVYRVINIIDAKLRISQGECIAVPAWMAEQTSDPELVELELEPIRGMFTDMPIHPLAERLELLVADRSETGAAQPFSTAPPNSNPPNTED